MAARYEENRADDGARCTVLLFGWPERAVTSPSLPARGMPDVIRAYVRTHTARAATRRAKERKRDREKEKKVKRKQKNTRKRERPLAEKEEKEEGEVSRRRGELVPESTAVHYDDRMYNSSCLARFKWLLASPDDKRERASLSSLLHVYRGSSFGDPVSIVSMKHRAPCIFIWSIEKSGARAGPVCNLRDRGFKSGDAPRMRLSEFSALPRPNSSTRIVTSVFCSLIVVFRVV